MDLGSGLHLIGLLFSMAISAVGGFFLLLAFLAKGNREEGTQAGALEGCGWALGGVLLLVGLILLAATFFG